MVEKENSIFLKILKIGCTKLQNLKMKLIREHKWAQKIKNLLRVKGTSPILSQIMSRNRYRELLKYIRFDIRSSRSERLQTDKFALVSSTWNRFIENCRACYIPNENITIDEKLFPTKARYPFTQYIASKPDKFGIKFWLAVDSKSTYLLNGFPFLGKDAHRPIPTSHFRSMLSSNYLNRIWVKVAM